MVKPQLTSSKLERLGPPHRLKPLDKQELIANRHIFMVPTYLSCITPSEQPRVHYTTTHRAPQEMKCWFFVSC